LLVGCFVFGCISFLFFSSFFLLLQFSKPDLSTRFAAGPLPKFSGFWQSVLRQALYLSENIRKKQPTLQQDSASAAAAAVLAGQQKQRGPGPARPGPRG
jgi:hypothetical protein